MSDNSQIKTYKNRHRATPEKPLKSYVPQYQVLGIEPSEYKSAVVPENQRVVAKPSTENPRARRQAVRQAYAQAVPSPVGIGRGPIPNVGNNVEHAWSSVDGEIVDDLDDQAVDPNHPMVDNNDFVSHAAFGTSQQEELPMLDEVQNPPRIRFTQQEVEHAFNQGAAPEVDNSDLLTVIHDLEEGSYLLLIQGTPVCSGPKEEIEEQARALVFGEHVLSNGNPIPDDDIVIIKRVPIKVGLFLD